ncbi:hypothetical protein Q7P37_000514 [Cladosporium fusiforme]
MGTANENTIASPTGDESKADILKHEVLDPSFDHDDEAQKTALDESISAEEAARVLRKIDWHLVPVLVLVNAIQLIDKNTLSSAATYGMIQQANLVGQEYSLLVALFYIGYLVAEYPSNYLMQKFPTGKYLTVNFILWGVVLACSGACTSFPGLAVCRFLLGVFEAPLNPGLIVITSAWWKTSEQARRVGVWYSMAGFINLPVAMVFYGLAHVEVGGMFPYQWIFIVFGLVTVLIGISLWWILPESPNTASFLNEREREVALERIRDNHNGVKNREHKRYQVFEALKDPKVWMLTFAVFFQNMTNALQNSFTGLIIRGLGFSTYEAVLLTMPQYAVMAVACLAVTWLLSTRWGQGKRIFAMILCYIPGIVGTVLLNTVPLTDSTVGVHLFAVYFINTIATSASILFSLLASNIAGYTKKSVVNSMFFIAYSLGNIISPQTFLQAEAPAYTTGIGVTLACFCVNILLFASLYIVYTISNRKREKEAEGQPPLSEEEKTRLFYADLTDLENRNMLYAK